MDNFERIVSRASARYNIYNNNLNGFRLKMREETRGMKESAKEIIDRMSFEKLIERINKGRDLISKVIMTDNESRIYNYGCMELMEKMESVDDKYAACRFFHILTMCPKKSLFEKKLFSLFFEHKDGVRA